MSATHSIDRTTDLLLPVARALLANGRTITGPAVAALLNRTGFVTGRGTPYSARGHGIYRLLSAVHRNCRRRFGEAEADRIAVAFVAVDGRPAWDR